MSFKINITGDNLDIIETCTNRFVAALLKKISIVLDPSDKTCWLMHKGSTETAHISCQWQPEFFLHRKILRKMFSNLGDVKNLIWDCFCFSQLGSQFKQKQTIAGRLILLVRKVIKLNSSIIVTDWPFYLGKPVTQLLFLIPFKNICFPTVVFNFHYSSLQMAVVAVQVNS